MKIKQEDLYDGLKQLTVEINRNDYAPRLDEELKKIRKTVMMPGFRPGKVPMNLIRKKYEKAFKSGIIEDLIKDALNDYVKDNNLEILGSFIPAESQPEYTYDEDDFEFRFDWHPLPDVEIDWKKLKEIPYYKIVYTDEDVEEEVKFLQESYSEWKEHETASDETVEIIKLQLPGDETQHVVIPNSLDFKDYASLTEGKKLGDKLTLTIKQLTEWFKPAPETLEKIETEKIDPETEIQAEIISVMKRELPELNEDFFKRIYPDKEIKDLKTFKEELKKHMNEEGAYLGRNEYIRQISKVLPEAIRAELPEAFMIRWLKHISENEISDEEARKQFEKHKNHFIFEVARTKKLNEKQVRIDSNDLIQAGLDIVEQYYRSNPELGLPPQPEQLYEIVMQSLNDRKFSDEAYELAANKKFIYLLVDEIGRKPQEISLEDYKKIIEKEQDNDNNEK